MYLKQLKITNYKSFLEPTEFNFEPGFNVLLGANSSGKSSVLEAIALNEFQNIPHRSMLNLTEIDNPPILGSSTSEVHFTATIKQISKLVNPNHDLFFGIGDQPGHFYTQELEHLQRRLQTERLLLDIKATPGSVNPALRLSFYGWPSTWRGISGSTQYPGLLVKNSDAVSAANYSTGPEDIRQIWDRIPQKIYKFSAERAVQHLSSHHANEELLPNAANLAYCIAFLSTSNPDLFSELNSLLHRVFPTIHWVGAPPNGQNQFELKVHTNPSALKRSDLAVPINRVGTGVGNALAMLYVALTAQTQRFILLEEPNSYLHPRALRELLAILAEIGGKHQFFITTHSSDVLRTIKASTVTLLEYDGQQTTVKQTTGDKLHELQAGLIDLGISLTDLHGCDKVLWVEGETEEAIFPMLLRYFYPALAEGIAVLTLHATGDFEARKFSPKKVAQIYKTLSEASFLAPPMVGIALDREQKSDSLINQIELDCAGVVHFLPKTMLEDYLLDAEAVAAVLSQTLNLPITEVQIDALLSDAKASSKCLLNPQNPNSKELHAANVLKFIFEQFDQLEYRKTSHGPQIAGWLIANKPTELLTLKDWFNQFICSSG